MTRLDPLPGVVVWWSAHTVLARAVPHLDDVAEAARRLVPLARGPFLYRRSLLRGALAGAGIAGPVSFERGARGGVMVRARDAAPFVSMASTRAMSACAISWEAPWDCDVGTKWRGRRASEVQGAPGIDCRSFRSATMRWKASSPITTASVRKSRFSRSANVKLCQGAAGFATTGRDDLVGSAPS